MNPIIITVISSIATLVVSIFAANYLNQRFIDRMLDQQTRNIDARLEQQTKMLDAKLDAMRAEFKSDMNALRGEIATLNARMTNLEQRIERVERQLNKVFKLAIPSI